MMDCKICQNQSIEIFTAKVLAKHQVKYFKCPSCNFMQTEEPNWLGEAYQEAITDLDIGYVTRNISLSEIVGSFITYFMSRQSRFVDYGGGYGLFVRLLRDKGFNFYRQDLHCKNIFADHFDIDDLKEKGKFDLLTAFEVFEHLVDPMEEINKMFQLSDSILFTTVLQPKWPVKAPQDWWYIAPETGQHISFYDKKALGHIAKEFDCKVYSDGDGLHLFTKKEFLFNPVKFVSYKHALLNRMFSRHFNNKKSLINGDSEYIKRLLIQKNL